MSILQQPLAIFGPGIWHGTLLKTLEQRPLPLWPYAVEHSATPEALEGCAALGLAGALIEQSRSQSLFAHASTASYDIDFEAKQAGRVDVLVCKPDIIAGYWAAGEALSKLLRNKARGATAMVLGLNAAEWLNCMRPLSKVSVSAQHLPQAEALLGTIPTAQRGLATAGPDHTAAAARATDLIIYAGGNLPLEVLQPYHTVLELVPMPSRLRQQVEATVGDHIDHSVLTALTLQYALECFGHDVDAEYFLG